MPRGRAALCAHGQDDSHQATARPMPGRAPPPAAHPPSPPRRAVERAARRQAAARARAHPQGAEAGSRGAAATHRHKYLAGAGGAWRYPTR